MISAAFGHPVTRTAALVWTLVMVYLASDSAPGGPELFHGQDKVLHAGAFGLLCALYGLGWPKSTGSPRRFWPVLGAMIFGATIELGQLLLTRTRSAEWLDLVADLFGIALAVLFLSIFNRKAEQGRSP